MLDIDHFKRFNDAFGHEAGDTVLRYGGEEFLLVMPGFGADQTAVRAEEIRSRIAGLELAHNGDGLGQITASIGLATAPVHCTYDRLVQAADAAVYRAKSLGRDRVVAAAKRRVRRVA